MTYLKTVLEVTPDSKNHNFSENDIFRLNQLLGSPFTYQVVYHYSNIHQMVGHQGMTEKHFSTLRESGPGYQG